MLQWRKIIIAGISGFACGKVYSVGKKHPDVVIPIIEGTILAGVCGSVLGLGISAYRKLPSHVYTISLGANFAITASTFLGLRQCMLFHKSQLYSMTSKPITSNQMDYLASTVSGGMTGTFISVLSWSGIFSLIQASFAGVVTGIGVQYTFNILENWRKRKALELAYPELHSGNKKADWSLASFQRVWLGFWYRQSHAAAVEQDILLLRDMIKSEREKLKLANDELGLSHQGQLQEDYGNRTITNNLNNQTNLSSSSVE